MVPSRFGDTLQEYPVVWCDQCHRAYFTCLPSIIWCHCGVNRQVMAFTTDPDKIDPRLKLAYDYKLVDGIKIFEVYSVSQK